MITFSGKSVWPKVSKFYDKSQVPTLSDIARGLSRMPRFAGQTASYYTVLAHTLTVADIVEPEYRLYALLHDAPEAIVADVPSPWKTTSAKDREYELLELITRHYADQYEELEWPWPQDAQDAVAQADYHALAAEAHVLGHAEADKHWPIYRLSRQQQFLSAFTRTMDRLPHAFYWAQHPEIAGVAYEGAFIEWVDSPVTEQAATD